ncbi:hypothetical protein D3OALGB2SA_5312 [Olavius algarvensis associated proteobacterium Delta 3]|nr:hypothetical protein D3OALGB2SA_5312 [Olavius algarvensis associated proteobacterium Delta 3]
MNSVPATGQPFDKLRTNRQIPPWRDKPANRLNKHINFSF